MTQTITSARMLYDHDRTFQALIHVWEEEKVCPVVVIDLLLEYGLESQAEAARWAVSKENQDASLGKILGEIRSVGAYPGEGTVAGSGHYRWAFFFPSDYNPPRYVPKNIGKHLKESPSVVWALLWLLDEWKT